jgi:hypothetical protein
MTVLFLADQEVIEALHGFAGLAEMPVITGMAIGVHCVESPFGVYSGVPG